MAGVDAEVLAAVPLPTPDNEPAVRRGYPSSTLPMTPLAAGARRTREQWQHDYFACRFSTPSYGRQRPVGILLERMLGLWRSVRFSLEQHEADCAADDVVGLHRSAISPTAPDGNRRSHGCGLHGIWLGGNRIVQTFGHARHEAHRCSMLPPHSLFRPLQAPWMLAKWVLRARGLTSPSPQRPRSPRCRHRPRKVGHRRWRHVRPRSGACGRQAPCSASCPDAAPPWSSRGRARQSAGTRPAPDPASVHATR